MRSLRLLRVLLILFALLAYATLGWVPGALLALTTVIVFLVRAVRLRRALRPTISCPRGHTVPVYGIFRCSSCGAVTESWAWRCPWCRAESGYIECPTCGLSCPSPLLGGR